MRPSTGRGRGRAPSVTFAPDVDFRNSRSRKTRNHIRPRSTKYLEDDSSIIQPTILIRQGSENVRDQVDEENSRSSRGNESVFASCSVHEFQTAAWLDEQVFPEVGSPSMNHEEGKDSCIDSHPRLQENANPPLDRNSTEAVTYMQSFGMPVDTTFMESLMDPKFSKEFWEAFDQFVRPQSPEDVEEIPCVADFEKDFIPEDDIEFDLTQHELQQRRARQVKRRQALIKLVSCFNSGERSIDDPIDNTRKYRPSRSTVTPIHSVSKQSYRPAHRISKNDLHQKQADLRSHSRACMLTPTTFAPHPKNKDADARKKINEGLGSIEVGDELIEVPFYVKGKKKFVIN